MKHQTLSAPANAGPAALRTFFNIVDQWELGNQDGQMILGTPSSTYFRWKSQPDQAHVDADKLERISYVLGIYKALHLIYSDAAVADGWLRRPNKNPLFGGHPPLERLLHGQVADLFVIRQHLDGRRGVT
jgi:hypothetical protein